MTTYFYHILGSLLLYLCRSVLVTLVNLATRRLQISRVDISASFKVHYRAMCSSNDMHEGWLVLTTISCARRNFDINPIKSKLVTKACVCLNNLETLQGSYRIELSLNFEGYEALESDLLSK